MTSDDAGEALRLSTRVGWNQTEVDWLRLIELNPGTCFLFSLDGRTAGTATLATFGAELAWIGMVIVDEPFRGRGVGRHILEAVIADARARGMCVVGLDATDEGRRLYLGYGFHDVQPIDRWAGTLAVPGTSTRRPSGVHAEARDLDAAEVDEVSSLDLECSEIDRSRLLERLLQEESTRCLGLMRTARLRGFAFLRAGRQFMHLGPVVADTEADFASLLDGASSELQGEPVLVDALRREETSALLEARGLRVQRRLTRMTLGAPVPVMWDPRVRAAVAFEWG